MNAKKLILPVCLVLVPLVLLVFMNAQGVLFNTGYSTLIGEGIGDKLEPLGPSADSSLLALNDNLANVGTLSMMETSNLSVAVYLIAKIQILLLLAILVGVAVLIYKAK